MDPIPIVPASRGFLEVAMERGKEILVPDLKSSHSQYLAIGSILLRALPTPIRNPLYFVFGLWGFYEGMKISCSGVEKLLSHPDPLKKTEAIGDLLGGMALGFLSVFTLLPKFRSLFFYRTKFAPQKGVLVSFLSRRLAVRRIYDEIPPRPPFIKGGNSFQAMRQGISDFFGTLALDLRKAPKPLPIFLPRKNNLFYFPLTVKQKWRLRVRDLEQIPILKKVLLFLDPITGKLKNHAQILLEEYLKVLLVSKSISPNDFKMSGGEKDNGKKDPIPPEDKTKQHPRLHVVTETEEVALPAPIQIFSTSPSSPYRFLSFEDYTRQWAKWGVVTLTPAETFLFSEATIGPADMFLILVNAVQRLEGETGEGTLKYFIRKIRRKLRRKFLTLEDLQDDLYLRKAFIKELIQIPAVREELLRFLVSSSVRRGELLAYKAKRYLFEAIPYRYYTIL